MKNKSLAIILSILFGTFGFQKFYFGKWVQGILCLIFCFTSIPTIIGIIEGLYLAAMTNKDFTIKYNIKYLKNKDRLDNLGYKQKTFREKYKLETNEDVKQFTVGFIFIIICVIIYYSFFK